MNGRRSRLPIETARRLYVLKAFNLDSAVTRAAVFEDLEISKETACGRLRRLQWEGYVVQHTFSPQSVVWWLNERGQKFVENSPKAATESPG